MKAIKGTAGYIEARRKQVIVKTVIEFGIVAALLILGFTQTKTRLNLLTVVAILGCLPASKALVEVITIMPYHSITPERAEEIAKAGGNLTLGYDYVFTNRDNFMPVDCVVILDNTVCGYSSSKKINVNVTGTHLRQMLGQNHLSKVSVKIFTDYSAFLSRVKEMQSMALNDRPDTRKKEETIRQLFGQISL